MIIINKYNTKSNKQLFINKIKIMKHLEFSKMIRRDNLTQ